MEKYAWRCYTNFIMKTSLNHLPESKQVELGRLAEVICEESDYVELVVLFGSYAQAENFYQSFKDALALEKFVYASFLLHQATESTFKCFLLVYTNYMPNEHYLAKLDAIATEILPEIAHIFPRTTQIEKDRFIHFDRAYIAARYTPTYQIREEDLGYLAERVLLEVVEQHCRIII